MKYPKVLQWALILALIIVLNLFFNFAIRLVSLPPAWDTFCPQKQVTIQPKNQTECVAQGGAWNEQGYPINLAPVPVKTTPVNLTGAVTGYCDLNFTCQKNFQTAEQVYNRNVFVVLVVLGLVALGVGFFITSAPTVALGLSLGGVLSFIIGTVRYWSDMNDYLRVVILGLALVALIWLGVKKLRE